MTTYKCPGCGGDIEETDLLVTTTDTADDFIQNIHRIRLDKSLKHVGTMEAACGRFVMTLALELQNSVTESLQRVTKNFIT